MRTQLVASWMSCFFLGVGTAGLAAAEEADFSRSGPYFSLSGMWVSDLYENELEDQLEDAFGPVLKEGLYANAGEHKDALLSLARFRTTNGDGLASLADYAGRMKPGQESIFYITGESAEA